jgi:hypothetical protein
MLVDLPPGTHQVYFKYKMTIVGWAGITLSIITMIIVIFFCLRMERMGQFINRYIARANKFIEHLTD